jgi:hypothetical protein
LKASGRGPPDNLGYLIRQTHSACLCQWPSTAIPVVNEVNFRAAKQKHVVFIEHDTPIYFFSIPDFLVICFEVNTVKCMYHFSNKKSIYIRNDYVEQNWVIKMLQNTIFTKHWKKTLWTILQILWCI